MKRWAFAGGVGACAIAGSAWGAADRTPSAELGHLLATATFLCRLIPMPAVLTGSLLLLLALTALAGLVALSLVYKTHRTVRRLTVGVVTAPCRLLAIAHTAGLNARVAVVSHGGPLAFTHGFVSPCVVVSQALCESLDDLELEAVLRHEAAHSQRRDPLRVLLARTLATAFAFIPFARPALDTYLCRLELAADRATVGGMGDMVPLASALHRVLLQQPRRELATAAVSALSASDVRIDHLLGVDTSPGLAARRSGRVHVVLFWLALVAAACLLIASASSAAHVALCLGC